MLKLGTTVEIRRILIYDTSNRRFIIIMPKISRLNRNEIIVT